MPNSYSKLNTSPEELSSTQFDFDADTVKVFVGE